MAKFSRISKLPKKERDLLLVEFCEALACLRTSQEVAHFLKDLLSEPEIEMLAKRVKIAKMLLEGKSYQDIANTLKVSTGTVGRIGVWLRSAGEGFRLVAKRAVKRKKMTEEEYYSLGQTFKRKYSRYFWPEILWENINKELDWRRRKKIKEIIETGREKKELFNILASIWREKQKIEEDDL